MDCDNNDIIFTYNFGENRIMKKIWVDGKPGWSMESDAERIKFNHEMQFGSHCKDCGYGVSHCICNDEVVKAYYKKKAEFDEELRKIWVGEKVYNESLPDYIEPQTYEQYIKSKESKVIHKETKKSKILLTVLCSWGFMVIVYIIVNVIRGWK